MTAPTQNRDPLPHIRVDRFRTEAPYQRASGGGDNGKESKRNRHAHGIRLAREYESAVATARGELRESDIQEWNGKPGFYLELESAPGSPLPEINWQNGIRLGATRTSDAQSEIGALYVPLGHESEIQKRINEYLTSETKTNKPKNQPLVEAIERVGPGTVESLWTDYRSLPANPQESQWGMLVLE